MIAPGPLPSLRRLMLLGAITFGVVVAVSISSMVSLAGSIRTALDRSGEQLIVEQRIADQIVSAAYGQHALAYRYLERPDPATLADFRARGEQAYAGIRQYLFRPMPLSSRLGVEAIKDAQQDFEVAAQHAFDLSLNGETAAARARAGELAERAATLEQAVHHFIADREQQRYAQRAVQEAALGRLRRATIAVALLIALVAILMAQQLRRRVMLPLYDLSNAVREVGDGAEHVRVAPQRYQEFQSLADSFDGMVDRIRVSRQETQARNEELTRTLNDLRQAQRELVQHEKLSAMGEMLAGLAHELNNPLAGILGLAECVRVDLAESADPKTRAVVTDLVDPLLAESIRARNLVRNLLQFARQSSARLEPVHLSEAVDVALGLRRHAFAQRGKTIELHVPSDLWVIAESQKLQLMIVNIVNNALDAIETSGTGITIVAIGDDAWVTLTFQDDGPGFQQPERVFDPFYTTKAIGEGTGLGLALVHRFASEFGGGVSADNAPGGGARIVIRMPAATEAVAMEPKPAPAAPSPAPALAGIAVPALSSLHGEKPPRILVVDDEPAVREAQRRILTRIGADTILASSGVAARSLLEEQPFDLVITDLRMPGAVSGRDLLDWLERERPALAARSFVVTGDIVSDVDGSLSWLPEERILAKPFDIAEYIGRVERALGRQSVRPGRAPAA